MKRIGILSDTHSVWDERFSQHFSNCDEIWHTGDIGDISIIKNLQDIVPVVRAVSGNIDYGEVRRCCPESLLFDLEGIRVYLTHIGGYPGKYSPGLKKLLSDENIKLMVCGHSHILKVIPDNELGLLHINPGAAGYHGWQKERTLVRLILDDGKMKDLDVITLGKNRYFEAIK